MGGQLTPNNAHHTQLVVLGIKFCNSIKVTLMRDVHLKTSNVGTRHGMGLIYQLVSLVGQILVLVSERGVWLAIEKSMYVYI